MGNSFASLFGSKTKTEVAPQPPTATKESPKTGNFAQDLLNAQNQCRAKHGASAMTISQKLCEDAQKWADHLASKDNLQHCEDRDGAGENLAYASGPLGGEETCKMWYDEIKDYDFKKPGFSGNTGHFTQAVWKASSEFGAGVAKTSSGSTYVVGRYLPAGNITNEGQFDENVLPEI